VRLRIAGYACGKITKVGSPYLAGQGPFPLDEWKSLLQDAAVVGRKETNIIPSHYPDDFDTNEYFFYEVISSYDAGYIEAINQFVQSEWAPEGDESALTWESRVKRMASERRSAQATEEDSSLPFTDIPFHLAAKDLYPSDQFYIQATVKHCHSRRFFITNTGYMGMAPKEAEIGDEIYICVGASVSFAFRDTHKDSNAQSPKVFRLVGECYTNDQAWRDLGDQITSPEYFDVI
jgi:hypothetical protein